ncbi:hypothetical protein Lal_00039763 [Lupinus albus]|nr:hypothetical protein Lal_00039763 [Lupinus albus]
MDELKIENETLDLIYSSASCMCSTKVIETPICETCWELKMENDELKNKITKFTYNSQNLNRLLASSKNIGNRTGLGFKHKSKKRPFRKHVASKSIVVFMVTHLALAILNGTECQVAKTLDFWGVLLGVSSLREKISPKRGAQKKEEKLLPTLARAKAKEKLGKRCEEHLAPDLGTVLMKTPISQKEERKKTDKDYQR